MIIESGNNRENVFILIFGYKLNIISFWALVHNAFKTVSLRQGSIPMVNIRLLTTFNMDMRMNVVVAVRSQTFGTWVGRLILATFGSANF
jgi:hypothetical protein